MASNAPEAGERRRALELLKRVLEMGGQIILDADGRANLVVPGESPERSAFRTELEAVQPVVRWILRHSCREQDELLDATVAVWIAAQETIMEEGRLRDMVKSGLVPGIRLKQYAVTKAWLEQRRQRLFGHVLDGD